MSSVEQSPDIIPASPEYTPKENSNATPLSRNDGLGRKHNRNKLSGNPLSLKCRGFSRQTSIPDSDDEVILSSDASADDIDGSQSSSDLTSVIPSSDLETSQNAVSPLSLSKPKNSFIRTPHSSLNPRQEDGRYRIGMVSSTPTFDPSTPVGEWRGSRKESLSDDESPIGNHFQKNRRGLIIDSDSESDDDEEEEEEFYSGREFSLQSTSNADPVLSSQFDETASERKGRASVKPLQRENNIQKDISSISSNKLFNQSAASHSSFSNRESIGSIADSDTSSFSALSSTKYIETVDSPPKGTTEGKMTKLYAGKYKIKPRSIESKKLDNQSDRELQDTSHSSEANISTTSTSSSSSVRSLNISNMSQAEIEQTIKSNKIILKTANINALPDKGAKIRDRISDLEDALVQLKLEKKDTNVSNCSINSNSNVAVSTSSSMTAEYNTIENCSSPEIKIISETKEDPVALRLRQLKEELRNKQRFFRASNPRALPDGGQKLQQSIADLEKEIMMTELKAGLDSKFKRSPESTSKPPNEPDIIEEPSSPYYKQSKLVEPGLQLSSVAKAITTGTTRHQLPQHVMQSLYAVDRDYGAKDYGGKLSDKREYNMIRLTSEAVESLHRTLKEMPDVETAEAAQPEGLKVELMPHQKRALCWLLWREAQLPPGGILADDMGLGKTLTMLALILRHKEMIESGEIAEDFAGGNSDEESSQDSDPGGGSLWFSKDTKKRGRSKLIPSRGTLVVCPATLLGQWEGEVKKRVSSKKASVLVYHGNNRDISIKRLSQYDLVITTYQLVMREAFSGAVANTLKKNVDAVPEIEAHDQGPLFRVGWTRIILDEAHQIRNHKSKTSQAACMLRGGRRWAVTGTPVQNREMDLYSLVRFLRVSPFDNYTCWKHQLKTSSAHGLRKLNLLVRVLLLRRTKDQIDQVTGEAIVQLPPKEVIQHNCCLEQEEREVYDRVFAFSRSSLIEYMKSQEEKEKEKAERSGQTFRPQHAFIANDNANKYTPTLQADILKADELKAHHMLVLLLRLRQICGHPALIRSIVDDEAKATDGLNTDEGNPKDDLEMDLIDQMNEMSLRETVDDEEIDNRVRDEILVASNPVFKKRTLSTKIRRVIEELDLIQKDEEAYEKAVIVSQWTSMLQIVYKHLKKNNISASAITGQIPVKDRASIVNEFNAEGKGPRVLLLSLSAGGVGLNLVGANHLFLLDMHWNPQLEAQACDRIFRVGQKRCVKIHRFVVKNTVEEKILELQQKKVELAESVLTGAKRTISNKLTLQDIKALFSVT